MGIIECSSKIWKGLTSEQDTLSHTQKACFSCSQRMKPIFVKNPLDSRTSELAQQLSRLDGTSASNRLMIEAKVLELLATTSDSSLLNNSPETEPCIRDVDQDALVAAAAYLEKNLAESHSLNAVSREARLNEFKLKKGFREHFQTTVFGYLRQKCMEHARKLFTSNSPTVLEVANAVGYSNPSHFSRAFRETFGLNPREFVSKLSR